MQKHFFQILTIHLKVRRGQCRKKLEFEQNHLIQVAAHQIYLLLVLAFTYNAPQEKELTEKYLESLFHCAEKVL